jgi:translation initiation factor 2 beta subunit (eIF-2beta)/eIF-5
MIKPGYVRTMAAYNSELNRRTFAAADTLPDAQRREDAGAFFRSLHGTLSPHPLGRHHVDAPLRRLGEAGRRHRRQRRLAI